MCKHLEGDVLRVMLTNPAERSGNLLSPPAVGMSGGYRWILGHQAVPQGVLASWRCCTRCPGGGGTQPTGFVLIGVVDPHENVAVELFT